MYRRWPARLLLAEAQPLLDATEIAAAAARYYRYFPASQDYHQVHDFDFWRLQPVRWRYIGGFGAIHWLDRVELANPFAGEAEQDMLAHMNADHAPALAHYVQLAGCRPSLLPSWLASTVKVSICALARRCIGYPLLSPARRRWRCVRPWWPWRAPVPGRRMAAPRL